MLVGDLVKHKKNGFIGLIIKCDDDPTPFDQFISSLSFDTLYCIEWIYPQKANGAHWKNEIEIISENR